jgi:hypothetical protein
MRGEVPVSYVIITTHMGLRAYAEKELGSIVEMLPYLADGQWIADGSISAGGDSAGVIEKSARVINFGNFERSLQANKDDVLGSYQSKTLQSMTIEIANDDQYFAKLIAKEPFIGRGIQYFVGFEDLPQDDHLSLFKGIVTEMSLMGQATVEAEER